MASQSDLPLHKRLAYGLNLKRGGRVMKASGGDVGMKSKALKTDLDDVQPVMSLKKALAMGGMVGLPVGAATLRQRAPAPVVVRVAPANMVRPPRGIPGNPLTKAKGGGVMDDVGSVDMKGRDKNKGFKAETMVDRAKGRGDVPEKTADKSRDMRKGGRVEPEGGVNRGKNPKIGGKMEATLEKVDMKGKNKLGGGKKESLVDKAKKGGRGGREADVDHHGKLDERRTKLASGGSLLKSWGKVKDDCSGGRI